MVRCLMTMRRSIFLFVLLSTAYAQRFGIEHYSKLARVSDPQIAPNGLSVVAVVGRPNYEANTTETDLLRVDCFFGLTGLRTVGVGIARWLVFMMIRPAWLVCRFCGSGRAVR